MTQIPQNPPPYMAAKTVTAGVAPMQIYSRFRTNASPDERAFVMQATSAFFETNGFLIQSVRKLFPHEHRVKRTLPFGRKIESVFLVRFAQDCGDSRFPHGLVIQSRAVPVEKALITGAKAFAALRQKTNLDFVQPIRTVTAKRRYVAEVAFNGATHFVYAHPYIVGRPPYANDIEMGRIGKAVAQLEDGMSRLPWRIKSRLYVASKAHNQSLCRASWYIVQNREWLRTTLAAQGAGNGETTKEIVRIADDFIQWQEKQEPAASHHMNLIPNHVLIQPSGKVAILDCTRLRDGFLPPHMDLGQIAARMLTCPTSIEGQTLAPEKQRGAVACFLAGYNNALDRNGRDPSSMLTFDDLRESMIRSLVLTKLLPQVTLIEKEPERAAKMTAYYAAAVTKVMKM